MYYVYYMYKFVLNIHQKTFVIKLYLRKNIFVRFMNIFATQKKRITVVGMVIHFTWNFNHVSSYFQEKDLPLIM